MQFSQALLAFAAVTAASVITVPRDTLDLEERANDSTVARDAGIELQARDAHVASDSDEVEEIPELEPRQTAAPTLVGGDDTGGRQERARQAKGGKLKRGADNNPAPPAERDAAPLPTPAPAALDADDDDADADMDVRARQAGGGSKPKSAAGAGGANKPKTAQAAGDKPQKSVQAGDKPKSAVVRDVEPRATPGPDLEERDEEVGEGEDDDDIEELEARQEPPAANEGKPKKSAPGGGSGGGGGSLEPVQGRGLKEPPRPAVVRDAEPRATPAPDLKEREEEDDDAEELEARQEKTQGGGGAKPPAIEKNPRPTVTVKVRAACTPVRREPQTVYVPVTPARVAERQPEKTAVFDA